MLGKLNLCSIFSSIRSIVCIPLHEEQTTRTLLLPFECPCSKHILAICSRVREKSTTGERLIHPHLQELLHGMAFLEIACFNTASALIANEAGVDRIEFCDGPDVGGITPDFETLSNVRDRIAIPVFVMIRPRGGDFVYTDTEFQQMRGSIKKFKDIADGFVFGLLDDKKTIDVPRTTELVCLAQPLPSTFHRAFDKTDDLCNALEDVVRCGISTVLTSGGASSASEGCNTLAKLVAAAGGRIAIMPGGGVRSTNVEELMRSTQTSFYHSSALVDHEQVASSTEILRLKAFCRASLDDVANLLNPESHA